MAQISISIDGIDQAIANLNYRSNSVKHKAISAIRKFYTSETALKQLHSIDTDLLIQDIWDTGNDPSKIRSKRRNFFSVKSSINTDLDKLTQKGLNPENITIVTSNIFDMTEEAKSSALKSFTDAVNTESFDLEQAAALLKTISEFLETYQQEKGAETPRDLMDQIQKILNAISDTVLDEDAPLLELDEDDEIEELDEDETIEELDADEPLEAVDELTEDELKALEEYREKKELAEQFDQSLGEREKKFNKYVMVPGGKYTVGTLKSLKSSLELQQFDMPRVYIGRYPVTNALFEIFIEQTGYVTTAEKTGYGRVYASRIKKASSTALWRKNVGSEEIKGACWYQPAGPGSSLHQKRTHPVVQISVDDANAFAAWIGRRIPTEAEWEAAARTDIGYTYPWGDTFNPAALNIEQTGVSDTTAVDEYDSFANSFGIVDMLGNVMEWTCDVQHPPVKSKTREKYCIAKGAAWNGAADVTISSRSLFKPGFTANIIGFRCLSEIFG